MTAFINTILNMSITAAVAALAVMLIRALFRKSAPKRIICLLWIIVAVRLVCPVTIESPFSVMPSDPVGEMHVFGKTLTQRSVADVPDTANAYVPAETDYKENISEDDAVSQRGDYANYEQVTVGQDSVAAERATETAPTAEQTVFYIWLAGCAVMLVYMLVSYILLYRRVQVNINTGMGYRIADGINSSFILGILKPTIYISSALYDDDRSYILAHENQHLRHLDYIWKPFGFLLLAANWFNPVIWVAYVLFCRDLELACDEAVISGYDINDRKAYSSILLKCSMRRQFIAPCPIAFGETGVKERVRAVRDYKKPTIIVIFALVLIAAIVSVAILTSPKKDAVTPSDTAKSDTADSATAYTESELYDAPLPLKSGEQLAAEWAHAEGMIDVDNDGKPDRVSVFSVESDDIGAVIVVEFGDGTKAAERSEFTDDIIHPQMVLSKYGDNTLIYLHEKSQGSSGEELIYILRCDTAGNVTSFDGHTSVTALHEASIYKLDWFTENVGTVRIKKNGDANVVLLGTEGSTEITVSSKYFTNAEYTGDYYVNVLSAGDVCDIDANNNVIMLFMQTGICYAPPYSYRYVCCPAIATLRLKYVDNTFVKMSVSFELNDGFVAENSATAAPSPTPQSTVQATPTPSPTPTVKPDSTGESISYVFTDTIYKDIDLDGDGLDERLEINNLSDGDDAYLTLSVYYSRGWLCFSSYAESAPVWNSYLESVRVADITHDGRLAVFVDYRTESPVPATYGFFVTEQGVEFIRSNHSSDDSRYLGSGIVRIAGNIITVYEHCDLLGTWQYKRTGTYHPDTNRIVYSKNRVRSASADGGDYLPKLKVTTFAYDEGGNRVDLPVGMGYQPIESDFTTYAWIKGSDGETYKIDIRPKDGWTFTINGIEQDDLFDGISYCG